MKKTGIFLAVIILISSVFLFTACGRKSGKVTEYDIVSIYDGNKTISGVEKVTFYNDTENAYKELKFNLFANAYRENAKYSPVATHHLSKSYPNGLNYGKIDILSVKDGDKPLEYLICGVDENILSVTLENEVFPDEKVCVTIEYSITLANVISRTGENENTINLACFYPILCAIDESGFYECVYYSTGDPFFSECANYKVEFTCPKEFIVANAGEKVDSKIVENNCVYNFELENARSFNLVLSKYFSLLTKEINGVTVNYYYYNDSEPERSLNTAVTAIKTYSDLFGKYPYKTFSVAETKFIEGGMEFPTLVMISDELDTNAYQEVIAHETAHQWWQTVVGNNEIEYGFLDEGLTEYSVVLFYENNPEYNLTREALVKSSEDTFKIFCSVYDKLYNGVNTAMIRPLSDFSSEYEYVNIAYIKSVIMYDTLRKTVGDDGFFKALKRYFKEYSFKIANPYSIVGVFEKEGLDTNGFFESFYLGKEIL